MVNIKKVLWSLYYFCINPQKKPLLCHYPSPVPWALRLRSEWSKLKILQNHWVRTVLICYYVKFFFFFPLIFLYFLHFFLQFVFLLNVYVCSEGGVLGKFCIPRSLDGKTNDGMFFVLLFLFIQLQSYLWLDHRSL